MESLDTSIESKYVKSHMSYFMKLSISIINGIYILTGKQFHSLEDLLIFWELSTPGL